MPHTCMECGKAKSARRFRQLTTKPATYSEKCLACLAKEESREEDLVNKEHRIRKETKRANRNLEKQAARDRARAQRTKQKKLKAELDADSAFKKEYASRVLAKRRLVQYIKRFDKNYKDGWVHHDICRRLEKFYQDVVDGKSPRLLLFMPPRHGKSLIASDYFPSWVLGHSPEFEIIASSYAVSLPLGFSKKIRGRIKDPLYQAMFPDTQLDPESTAAEGWNTLAGGGYIPAGVGGGITGKGGHILIFDDPVKDAEEADSETHREKVWDWYGSTFKTRLAPGGGILGIQTRWHDADLSGKLIDQMKALTKELDEQILAAKNDRHLAEKDGDEVGVARANKRIEELQDEYAEIDSWEIISYPALATDEEWLTDDNRVVNRAEFKELVGEDRFEEEFTKAKERKTLAEGGRGTKLIRWRGDALHPDRFPRGRLLNMKRSMQPRHWSALYQQNPVPDDGMYFTKSMLRRNPSPPIRRDMHIYSAWDLAIGEKQTNDFTVGVVGGLDWDDQLHILDVIRGKWGDPATISKIILDTYKKYNCQMTGMERGQLYLAIMPQLKKDIRRRRMAVTFDETLTPITDKQVRARPLQGRMQQGMVDFWSTQPWFEEVVHELMRFPGGVHDDIVDALAWLVRMVMKKQPPKRPRHKQPASWKKKLLDHTRSNGGGMMAA